MQRIFFFIYLRQILIIYHANVRPIRAPQARGAMPMLVALGMAHLLPFGGELAAAGKEQHRSSAEQWNEIFAK